MKNLIKVMTKVFMILFFTLHCGTELLAIQTSLLTDQLDQEIKEKMEEGDITGLTLIMINGQEKQIINYGYADKENNELVTNETLFQLGSCSKAFTALAVTKLETAGQIDLDKNVVDYLPWFKVSFNDKTVNITLRQLIHHTSGIPWNTISKIPESDEADALEKTVRSMENQELKYLPGEQYHYATINYDVLAYVIQKVTGTSFEEYLQNEVIAPLELTATSVGKPKDTQLMATGYKIGFFDARPYEAPVFKGNNAAGYVISNANDISKWLSFQLGQYKKELFPLAAVTHQRDESVALHDMMSYARGWEVALDGSKEISHTGLNPNFTTFMGFRPDENIAVAVLANSNSNNTFVIGKTILNHLSEEPFETNQDTDGIDKTFSIVSIILFAYLLVVTGYLIYIFVEVSKSRRKFEALTWKKLGGFLISVLASIPFLYGIYLIPEAVADFTWEAILVWMPVSFQILLGLIITVLTMTYLTSFFSRIFPSSDKLRSMAPNVILLSIISGLCNMMIIVLVTSSLDSDIELKYLLYYYGVTLSIYILGSRHVQTKLTRFSRELTYDLRIKLIDKIFDTTYQSFEKLDRGKVYTSLNDDVGTIGQSTDKVVMLFANIFTVVAAFAYLATIALWATLLTIFLLFTLAFVYFLASESTSPFFEQARDSRNTFMRLINGMIDGYKEISLSSRKKTEYKKDMAASANEYKTKITIANIRFVNAFMIGESFLIILLGMIAFAIPALFPSIQNYTIMSFLIFLIYLIGPINGILNTVPMVMELKVALNRIKEFLSVIPAGSSLLSVAEKSTPVVNSFRADNIGFQYKNDLNESVFGVGDIDLEVNSGEVLFIIGGNGSGKTTLAKLLTGLYSPDSGHFSINGKEVNSAELSEKFSVVFSPAHLFDKLYDIDTTKRADEVDKYLKLLNLDHKVTIDDNKYSTLNLSGGQRKRLALLQCYMEDSPIYLFDEWAADQDPDYRKFYYRTLIPEMRKQGKIVIAITHDDHYFDVADKVMKMVNGKLEVYQDHKQINELEPVL